MSPPITKAQARKELERRRAAAQRERWRADPVLFSREALGVELWSAQVGVANSIAAERQTSWRASQKVGKSTLIACLGLWRVFCFDRGLAVATSGNESQIRIVIWREVRRLYHSARVPLGGTIALDPATGLRYDDGRAFVAVTAKDAERMGGYSSPELLMLLDEASAIDDAIIEAAIGNLAGGGTILLSGNPTKVVGFFARTHRERLEDWDLHHTSTLHSPNVRAGRVVVPGLAKPDFPQKMAANFGVDSAAYQVRVLGEYPSEGSDCVISLALVERATADYDTSIRAEGQLEVGVDPARFGDDESCIQGRIGYRALPVSAHRGLDNVEVAARVVEYVAAHRCPGFPVIVRVDTGGLGGGVFDHLVRAFATDAAVTVESVNASQASTHPTKFLNARAQGWFAVRRWLERGGTLPPDQKRDAELLAAKYTHDAKLRVQVLSKNEMKKTLRRSPDRADALALAVFSEHPLGEGEAVATSLVELPPHASRVHPVMGARSSPWGAARRTAFSGAREADADRQRQLGAGPGGWRR